MTIYLKEHITNQTLCFVFAFVYYFATNGGRIDFIVYPFVLGLVFCGMYNTYTFLKYIIYKKRFNNVITFIFIYLSFMFILMFFIIACIPMILFEVISLINNKNIIEF